MESYSYFRIALTSCALFMPERRAMPILLARSYRSARDQPSRGSPLRLLRETKRVVVRDTRRPPRPLRVRERDDEEDFR